MDGCVFMSVANDVLLVYYFKIKTDISVDKKTAFEERASKTSY